MVRIFAILLVLFASGCATSAPVTGTPPAPASGLSSVAAFTVADLQAAAADADAQNPPDVTASQCYKFLAAVIPGIQVPGAPATVGAFVVFQKSRDLLNGFKGGANAQLTALNLACAPLVTDVNFTVARLGVLGAGAVATGGVLIPLAP